MSDTYCNDCRMNERVLDRMEYMVKSLRAENEKLRASLKEICDEWNEGCEPKCSSWGHDNQCKGTNIGAAKRALMERIKVLEAKLKLVLDTIHYEYCNSHEHDDLCIMVNKTIGAEKPSSNPPGKTL